PMPVNLPQNPEFSSKLCVRKIFSINWPHKNEKNVSGSFILDIWQHPLSFCRFELPGRSLPGL
ncbi:hypothetical protein, partial [Zhenpiania hominis]|uniref:hypothetical protein n=1 Tax=Zhenpiania hominis TaxID=2763644 RepID=UPI0039F5F1D9